VTTAGVTAAGLEQALALREPGLTAIVLPAPWAPLTALPAAVHEDAASVWHRPGDRSFAGIGVAAKIDVEGPARWITLRERSEAVLGALRVTAHEGAPPVRPALVGGLAFEAGWTDDRWHGFGDGSFVLHRWTYERGESATLTLVVDDTDTTTLLAEYDRILDALSADEDRLFVAPEPSGRELTLRQMSMAEWIEHVRAIQRELDDGAFAKIVAARRCDIDGEGLDALSIVARMATTFEDCTSFLFRRGERAFVGATPELLFRTRGRTVESQALAGSLQVEGGAANREALLAHSRKNRGEHDVVVRAILAGLDDHCVAVEYPPEPEVVHVRNLIHLSTPIRGELRDGAHPVDILETLHPTPAVGGVPRLEAMRWIVDHEPAPRGWYSGPIGWIDTAGDATFRVALRGGVVDATGAHAYTGAGIVAESNPAAEYHETALKQRPFLRALA